MEFFSWATQFFDVLMHLDVHLNEWVRLFDIHIYWILFLIIFCETGLVITPFLPGDSLLFALGALSAGDNASLNLYVLFFSLIVAGIVGDAVNYTIGRKLGTAVFSSETSALFNKKHLFRTQVFYEKYGGKTIILARFIPIIRTFAPFVAGVGKMKYQRFAFFNVIGAIAWVSSFLLAGHYFGNLPAVKKNFHLVILAIIIISIMPAAIEWIRARRSAATTSA